MTDIAPLRRALTFGAWTIFGFGLVTALSVLPGVREVWGWLIDLVIWPLDGAEGGSRTDLRLLTAIAGGICAGWGVTLLLLTGKPLEAAPEQVRRAFVAGYLGWFAVDSTASILAGAPWNLLGNLAFLALLMLPLRGR